VPRVLWEDEVAFACAIDQCPAVGGLQPVVVAAEPVEQFEHGDVCGGLAPLQGKGRSFTCEANPAADLTRIATSACRIMER
jgi:hypothetical protein